MISPFSASTRAASLAELANGAVDVLVIGGGITGAGIARDAAMRGLRTALVERGDFATGTSGRSSRLVHGGLRYLEHYAFRLVHESVRERRILLRIAPHLVWPRSFLFPLYAGGRVPRWQLAAGMWLYDALASFRNVERHRWLSKRAMLRAEPRLRAEALLGGARYYDAQCDDARLTLANVRDAHRYGALVASYAEVEGFDIAAGRVRAARVVDRLTGDTLVARAQVVVNATGPWSDAVRQDGCRMLQFSKGAHVVIARSRLGLAEAVTILSPVDGRVMFALPWGDLAYIGTTESPLDDAPADITADAADVVYLLRSANAVFPDARLQPDDVIATWAGVRPLVRPPNAVDPGAVPREHVIVEAPGLVSVLGGKLTTYRRMAADTVDRVAAALHGLDGRTLPPRARTDSEPLPGGETADLDLIAAEVEREGIASPTARRLVQRYGSEAPAVARLAAADPKLGLPIATGASAIRAELIYAVQREMALTLPDLLIRRTHVFYETPGHGLADAADLAALVAPDLGWDAARCAAEVDAYRNEVARAEAFRHQLR
ncbi:MAG: glycerol-3-phosphate dehydrogenase/oxidase [Gemmatimonadota bacterium]|nr:glycerol-3-phosphate dehydrogenase/oxidase [Gemmatimonadota bacterium]